jgi:nucleotide-binding universal stress UspA family protein
MTDTEPTGRIVVGVDGSEPSLEALRWAIGEARLRGGHVQAVHVWHYPAWAYSAGIVATPVVSREDLEAGARIVLDKAVDSIGADAGPPVERLVIEGGSAHELVDCSLGAALLVVGHRGHGGFVGLMLGSVAQQCSSHARCPVVIVRSLDGTG